MTAVETRTSTSVLDLGSLYISDFLAPGEEPRADPWPLELVMDHDTGVVHLTEQPPPELMWGRYWYRSGTNASMRAALADVAWSVTEAVDLQDGDVWVDIACNDGTLLACVPAKLRRIGVDPASGDIADAARSVCDQHYQQPFGSSVAFDVDLFGKAKVITCIAMFYDLPDPTDFLAGVRYLLADDGVFVVQVSYTPLMLEQLAFDNICHEHARYYTLRTLRDTLHAAGLRVVDAELNDVNGGSIRVTAMRDDADVTGYRSAPGRDVANFRIAALLTREAAAGYNTPAVWERFGRRVAELRADVVHCIIEARGRGQTVYGYGASTKGNTLLQYFGLDHTMIDAIAERQPGKVGLRTVGTDIPIVSEDDMRAARPDYLLMLPWHFVGEFRKREAAYLAAGGRFILPCPRFEIVP